MVSGAHAWEPTGHTLITNHALALVSPQMMPFYEANSRYIVAFCTLPDDWRVTYKSEVGPNHFIDLDLLSKPPFKDVIMDRAAAEKRFGRDQLLKAGILPWAIEETWNRLVAAMKSGDSAQISVQSAVLSHYIADAHVPLHNCKDYDGRTPEQKGLHFRWEQTLLLTWLKPEMVNACSPAKIEGPILNNAFGWCIDSFGYCDDIFDADDTARKLDPKLGYRYYDSMWKLTGPMMINQLDRASERLAAAWIAAYNQAGGPKLSENPAPYFWKQ